jgi:hypothetical protein
MIAGLFAMAAANGALLLAAHAVLRRIRTGSAPVDAVLFVLIHLLLVSVAVLAAGVTGFLTPAALGISGAVVLGALLLLREHRLLPRPSLPDAGRWTGLLAAMLGLRTILQVWFLAPTSPDALSYHLPKVAEWVLAGAFTREMGTDYVASFPAGFELIETWWVVFLHHDVLIEMAGVEFAVLAFLAVRLLALQLGLSGKAAFLAGILYLLTPAFGLQTISCLNDGAVAALVLTMASLIVARAHPVLLLLPLGLVAGIKSTGLFAFAGWALLWFMNRKEPRVAPGSMKGALAVAASAAVAGAFWYVRNYLWFGNPLHPVKSGPLTYYERLWYVQVGPSLSSLTANLEELVTNLVFDRTGFTGICWGSGGWGIVAFSIGVLALLHQIRDDRALRTVAAAFLLSMGAVLLMVKPDAWFSRFILFVPAILCIAAARLAESTRPVAILLVLGCFVQFAGGLLPQDRPVAQYVGMMRQPWRQRSAAAMLEMVPPGDPIGVYATLRSPIYPFYGPDFSRHVVYLRVSGPGRLAEEMERRGVRHVYVHILERATYDLEALVKAGQLRRTGRRFFILP